MKVLAVINRPDRRLVHAATGIGIRILSEQEIAALPDDKFNFYRKAMGAILCLVNGTVADENASVMRTADYVKNAVIREEKSRSAKMKKIPI